MQVQSPTSGRVLAIGGSEVVIKISSRLTEAGFDVVLDKVPAGFGPPAHDLADA